MDLGIEIHAGFGMSETGSIRFEAESAPRFLELEVFCEFYDLSQHLDAANAGTERRLELVRGWNRTSVSVAPGSTNVVLAGAASPYLPIRFETLEAELYRAFAAKGDEVIEINLRALHAGRETAACPAY